MSHNEKGKKFNVYDLFRDLEKFYGVLYMLLLVFVVFLGARYVQTLDYNKLFSAPELLAADTNMRVPLAVKKGTMTPPVDVIKFSTPSPDLITKGKELYTTNCASCHGETGQGNGPAGAALNPPPRNFADPKNQTWKNGELISQMYVTLQEGIPNTGMASFSTIPPEDRFAIIQYVRTFSPVYPKDTPEELKKLDEKYSLATGVKAANQIPVQLAMDLMVLGKDTLVKDLDNILAKIETEKSDTSAVIFKKITSNKTKALTSLASNMKWTESNTEFMNFLKTDPLDKGFRAGVFQLSPADSERVWQYLRTLFEKNRL
ncbi:MAG: cytochrome c [Bacteroidetes bacterium]|nr:cytochrome c [Bacteroidota bacterium]